MIFESNFMMQVGCARVVINLLNSQSSHVRDVAFVIFDSVIGADISRTYPVSNQFCWGAWSRSHQCTHGQVGTSRQAHAECSTQTCVRPADDTSISDSISFPSSRTPVPAKSTCVFRGSTPAHARRHADGSRHATRCLCELSGLSQQSSHAFESTSTL